MKISQRGIDLIKAHEGLRLHAYDDGVGVWTIGYGHTKDVRPGLQISEQQAEQFLRDDLAWVEQCLADKVRVSLTQEQHDALASLIFNIGAGAFERSTLLRKLNAGDYSGAAAEFDKWKHGGGRELPGLVKRRASEKALFLGGTTTRVNPTPTEAPRPDQEPYVQPEATMPIPAIVGALLPAVVELIPKLGGLFGSGSKVAERNVAAASAVLDIVQSATKSVNAQEAVERIKADPVALTEATRAIEARWFDLVEGGGGGIDGARKADEAARAKGDLLQSPSFWVALALLPLAYLIVGAVVGLFGAPFSEDVRAAIANGVVGMVIGALAGYYFGQTTSRNRTPQA